MQSTRKIIVWSITVLFAFFLVCVAFALLFDWNKAKPWINTHISEASGRNFAINGNLSLQWERTETLTNTWRDWVPVPRLSAYDVVLGNPTWSQTPSMARVGHITFTVSPLPLLTKKIVIPFLELDNTILMLERHREGKNNWTFRQSPTPFAWNIDLQNLIFHNGNVTLKDDIKRIDAKANIDSLNPSAAGDYVVGWKLSGSFNGAPISGYGKAGALLALKNTSKPFPLEADLHVGQTSIRIKGNVTKPQDIAAINMRLGLSGTSMADLYPLTGITLPKTQNFSTEGHLIGTTSQTGAKLTYENFSGKVGESDIHGTLTYGSRKPRPFLYGTVVSNFLRLSDLGTVIGADSNESKEERGVIPNQPSNKVLPVEKFTTEHWGSIDADVNITGRKIVREQSLPIENLSAHLKLQDSVITLTPLNFGVAGGNIISNITLDGRNHLIKAEAKISARHLQLKQLFPTFKQMQASLGEINGDTSLSATGNSVATMLASSNGEIKGLINQGTISKLLLEQMGLNIGNIIVARLFGDRQVRMNCMATDLSVTNGLIQTQTLIIDTTEAIINVSGKIDLSQETLDLTIHPQSKGVRIISLRTPLYVTGTFKHPEIHVDKGVIVLKAGSAVALGVLAPVTALLPLVNLGENENNACSILLKQVRSEALAPPPGKIYKKAERADRH